MATTPWARRMLILLGIPLLGVSAVDEAFDKPSILHYVDPLIGTVNGGHVFPGASLPYGMAKAVADTKSHGENNGGFVSDDSPIIGFSHLHDSGTGGSPSLGNFPLFIHPGCPGDDYKACNYSVENRKTPRVNGTVNARPGYFGVRLENDVLAEMTVTMHTALYRFTVPHWDFLDKLLEALGDTERMALNPLILLDLSDLSGTQIEGRITVSNESKRMVGEGRFNPSFGDGTFNAYFCADFKGAELKNSGVFVGDTATEGEETLVRSACRQAGSAGGWFQFEEPKDEPILARVGLSFKSHEQACRNAEHEIPDWDFDRVLKDAEDAWSNKLSAVEIDRTGVSKELQTTFWSGLYRSFLLPENYTGENPLWESEEPYFDSFYCIWDSFRAQHPLLTIVDPKAQAEMVRSLIDVYRHLGHLPDCRMSFCKGFTQGGSNADVVIADAFVKNINEGIDWKAAYHAVLADAEKFGFIAVDHFDTRGQGPHSRTASRTLEYAYDDYCISVLAEGLGYTDEAEKYLARSGNWKNVWDSERDDLDVVSEDYAMSSPFVGFPQPRYMNGTFMSQKTRACSPTTDMHKCYLETKLSTYEGSPWLYSFYVPQDMAGLIDVMGGKENFTERLDYFHHSGMAYMGNEQGFLTVYQFHYSGRPSKSSEWVHRYIPGQFNESVNGIPGNDDSSMGAFTAMAMMGFFPVAGQPVYLLTAPFFREVRLRGRDEAYAVIRSTGIAEGTYIQSATLDGNPYEKNWISYEFFERGGVLEFVLGSEESTWGTQDEHLPPSHGVGPRALWPSAWPSA
ncbi:hypothetical protein G7046_g9929 [Stylonectria norvegica]|nr:hypothetical protein G7046_g9929 [Stylonectria norvegica]